MKLFFNSTVSGLDIPIHGEHAYPPEAYDDVSDLERILRVLESGQITASQLGQFYTIINFASTAFYV